MLNLADFALQEQPEGNLMVAISRAWYNGSYIMAAKPIKSLELHYTMIQFLIIKYIQCNQQLKAHIRLHTENGSAHDYSAVVYLKFSWMFLHRKETTGHERGKLIFSTFVVIVWVHNHAEKADLISKGYW